MISTQYPFSARVGATVEIVTDTRAIGGVISAHVCFGRVERFTKTLVIVRNEHGNESRFYRATSRAVGTDRLTPSRLIQC